MKKLYQGLLILIMLIFDGIYIVNAFQSASYSRLATYLALPALILLPWLGEKIFKIKIDENLKILYLSFLFLADFLGCVVGLYNSTAWFDLFAHFLSGVLTALCGILFMKFFHYKENKLATILYVLGITALVALVWEFFEYGMDNFSGTTLQHANTTGVADTMEDMIAAFFGSISFLLLYLNTKKESMIHRFLTDIKL